MSKNYILNRSSVIPLFIDETTARSELIAMLKGLALLDDADEEEMRNFRCHVDPWLIPLASVGELTKTFGDIACGLYDTIDHDVAVYFDSLCKMTPPDFDLNGAEQDMVLGLEIEGHNETHIASYETALIAAFDITLCVVSKSILASFIRENIWIYDQFAFRCRNVDYFIDNVANETQARQIIERRCELVRSQLTPRNFWQKKEEAFKNLRFGIDVESQIGHFDANLLPLLFRRFSDLNRRAALWRSSGTFPELQPPITPESAATMRRYGAERNFRSARGVNETFEDHIWVDSLHRIHLIRRDNLKIIEIGYVGRHLSTIKFPT